MHPADARHLALTLMQSHHLQGWSFRFDHARRRFGSCRCHQRVITLSKPLVVLNNISQVRDTILHEIAHALTPGQGHSPAWRQKCREIGARPLRCYTDSEVASPPRAPAPYRLGCKSCNWWIDRRRNTRRKYVCTKCRTPLELHPRQISDG